MLVNFYCTSASDNLRNLHKKEKEKGKLYTFSYPDRSRRGTFVSIVNPRSFLATSPHCLMPRTRFYVTGFGPFLPDAPHNPTQALVERLDGMKAENATEVMADAAGASGAESTTTPLFALVDCRVVDVETESAIAAVNALAACIESTPCEDGDDACRVLVRESRLFIYRRLDEEPPCLSFLFTVQVLKAPHSSLVSNLFSLRRRFILESTIPSMGLDWSVVR